jgi:hypothetical protein
MTHMDCFAVALHFRFAIHLHLLVDLWRLYPTNLHWVKGHRRSTLLISLSLGSYESIFFIEVTHSFSFSIARVELYIFSHGYRPH